MQGDPRRSTFTHHDVYAYYLYPQYALSSQNFKVITSLRMENHIAPFVHRDIDVHVVP